MSEAPLLEVVDLVKAYAQPRARLFAPKPRLRAVDTGVSFSVTAGRSFGNTPSANSGSGKSTLARAAIALEQPTSGEARLMGLGAQPPLPCGLAQDACAYADDLPGSLMVLSIRASRVARIVAEPLACLDGVARAERAARIVDALQAVGLKADDALKYPHE